MQQWTRRLQERRQRQLDRRRLLSSGRPTPLGRAAAIQSIGGTTAPLLAGFSVTALVLALEPAPGMRWPEPGRLLLSVATVLFVTAVHCTFHARQFMVTPDDAKAWFPDLDHDPERRDRVMAEVRAHRWAHDTWVRRANVAYSLAMIALPLSIAVLLVPSKAPGPVRIATIGVFAFAAASEGLSIALAAIMARPDASWVPRALRWAAWSLTSADPLRQPPVGVDPDTATQYPRSAVDYQAKASTDGHA